jgi:ribonuclease D
MITHQQDLLALLDRLRGAPEVALDCEFEQEGRYTPELGLVQVAGAGELAAIDPIALDLAPLGGLLADASVVKLFHAGENDIPLLARATRSPVRNVFDTQIAAPFVGYRAAVSYTHLVERLCGVVLRKDKGYTRWTARPLEPDQVAYALDDVKYLPTVATTLREELARLGRLEWAAKATDEMVAAALAPRDPSTLYLKLRIRRELNPRQLAILREVTAWRDSRAQELNRAPTRVASDEALVELAADPPRSRDDIAQRRGLQGVGPAAGSLLAAIRRALEVPESEWPGARERRERDERTELVGMLLAVALRVRARELGLASSVVAGRGELEKLAAWHTSGRGNPPPELVAASGWKGDAVGQVLLAVLDGQLVLRADREAAAGVVLIPASEGGPSPR